jgi:prepilin-type processing-associated H-X9-DG protein
MPEPFITGVSKPPLYEAICRDLPRDSRAYACPGDAGYVHARCGTSYVYLTNLSGMRPQDTPMYRFLKITLDDMPVAFDFDGFTDTTLGITVPFFHVKRNLLFADGHVGEYRLKSPESGTRPAEATP